MFLSDLFVPTITLAIIVIAVIVVNAIMYRRRVWLRNKRLASMRRHPSYVEGYKVTHKAEFPNGTFISPSIIHRPESVK